MTTPVLNQVSFRARGDTVGLNVDTWDYPLNTGFSQDVDTVFRVRFTIAETAGGMANNIAFTLQYNRTPSGGSPEGYVAIGDTAAVRSALSSQFTNGEATEQRISSGSFVAGAGYEQTTTSNISLVSNRTEIEWSLLIDSAQVDNGDTIDLRVVQGGSTVLNTYTATPTITVVEAVAPQEGAISAAASGNAAFGAVVISAAVVSGPIAADDVIASDGSAIISDSLATATEQRITEDGEDRITEDGELRVISGPDVLAGKTFTGVAHHDGELLAAVVAGDASSAAKLSDVSFDDGVAFAGDFVAGTANARGELQAGAAADVILAIDGAQTAALTSGATANETATGLAQAYATLAPATEPRITEDGEERITEDGAARVANVPDVFAAVAIDTQGMDTTTMQAAAAASDSHAGQANALAQLVAAVAAEETISSFGFQSVDVQADAAADGALAGLAQAYATFTGEPFWSDETGWIDEGGGAFAGLNLTTTGSNDASLTAAAAATETSLGHADAHGQFFATASADETVASVADTSALMQASAEAASAFVGTGAQSGELEAEALADASFTLLANAVVIMQANVDAASALVGSASATAEVSEAVDAGDTQDFLSGVLGHLLAGASVDDALAALADVAAIFQAEADAAAAYAAEMSVSETAEILEQAIADAALVGHADVLAELIANADANDAAAAASAVFGQIAAEASAAAALTAEIVGLTGQIQAGATAGLTASAIASAIASVSANATASVTVTTAGATTGALAADAQAASALERRMLAERTFSAAGGASAAFERVSGLLAQISAHAVVGATFVARANVVVDIDAEARARDRWTYPADIRMLVASIRLVAILNVAGITHNPMLSVKPLGPQPTLTMALSKTPEPAPMISTKGFTITALSNATPKVTPQLKASIIIRHGDP